MPPSSAATFDESRVEDFLPAVQALHISSAVELGTNFFPILRSKLFNERTQQVILIITKYLVMGPKSFLRNFFRFGPRCEDVLHGPEVVTGSGSGVAQVFLRVGRESIGRSFMEVLHSR